MIGNLLMLVTAAAAFALGTVIVRSVRAQLARVPVRTDDRR